MSMSRIRKVRTKTKFPEVGVEEEAKISHELGADCYASSKSDEKKVPKLLSERIKSYLDEYHKRLEQSTLYINSNEIEKVTEHKKRKFLDEDMKTHLKEETDKAVLRAIQDLKISLQPEI